MKKGLFILIFSLIGSYLFALPKHKTIFVQIQSGFVKTNYEYFIKSKDYNSSKILISGVNGDEVFFNNQLIAVFNKSETKQISIAQLIQPNSSSKNLIRFHTSIFRSFDNPIDIKTSVQETHKSIFETKMVQINLMQHKTRLSFVVFGLLILGVISWWFFPKILLELIFPFKRSTFSDEFEKENHFVLLLIIVLFSISLISLIALSFDHTLQGHIFALLLLLFVSLVLVKFLAAKFIDFVFSSNEVVFTQTFFSWLWMFSRLLLIYTVAFIGYAFMDLNIALSIREFLLIVFVVSITQSIYYLLKNFKSLYFTHLFFYLCALETLPLVITLRFL